MALSLATSSLSFSAAPVAPRANVRMETVKDLEALADAQKIPMGCAPAATHACIPHTLAT